jgi:hypothetical protein
MPTHCERYCYEPYDQQKIKPESKGVRIRRVKYSERIQRGDDHAQQDGRSQQRHHGGTSNFIGGFPSSGSFRNGSSVGGCSSGGGSLGGSCRGGFVGPGSLTGAGFNMRYTLHLVIAVHG